MTDRTLTVDGIDIQALQLGAGPTLVWLHGYDSHPGEEEFLGNLATAHGSWLPCIRASAK
jgi:hypothetical protein